MKLVSFQFSLSLKNTELISKFHFHGEFVDVDLVQAHFKLSRLLKTVWIEFILISKILALLYTSQLRSYFRNQDKICVGAKLW